MYEDLFYKRLAELRANKGVSARDMSLSIGQSAGYINALDNRNGFPSCRSSFISANTLASLLRNFLRKETGIPVSTRKFVDWEHSRPLTKSLPNVKAID